MEKPKIHITKKGFKILDVTIEHCLGWGGIGICDSCDKGVTRGKYIAVLNSYYCEDCFNDWHKGARNYPEDAGYEQAHLEDILFRIALA